QQIKRQHGALAAYIANRAQVVAPGANLKTNFQGAVYKTFALDTCLADKDRHGRSQPARKCRHATLVKILIGGHVFQLRKYLNSMSVLLTRPSSWSRLAASLLQTNHSSSANAGRPREANESSVQARLRCP